MAFAESFRIGPFLVDETGQIMPAGPDATPSFAVRWRGRRISARVGRAAGSGDTQGTLSLEVILGRVPSTAGQDSAVNLRLRSMVFDMLHRLPQLLPMAWRLSLLPDHSIGVSSRSTLRMPTTATSLVTALTLFLLDLEPYLDLLEAEETGIERV